MNSTINSFLKPGTSLMEAIVGLAAILFLVAGTAGFMGWLSVQADRSAPAQSTYLAAPDA